MKYLKIILIAASLTVVLNCKNETSKTATVENKEEKTKVKSESSVKVIPISHGTLVLESDDNVIYVDPTGGAEAFAGQKPATIVLITDIHGDHLNIETLNALNLANVPVIVPQAVADKLAEVNLNKLKVLNNGETTALNDIDIEAIPMYNLREEALQMHPKGRGNGYLLTIDDERIYISGDTEDIPEMRSLKNIDKAFVCMNLPYTMPVESAASAVLDFKPTTVYPYHYRGTDGLSDVDKFKSLINQGDASINVELLEWYK